MDGPTLLSKVSYTPSFCEIYFSGTVVGDLIEIDRTLHKEGYLTILQESTVPSVGRHIYLPEDDEPKDSPRLGRTCLMSLEQEGKLIWTNCPPQSPDLPSIELLRNELDRRIRKRRVSSAWDLSKLRTN
ncbi:hypothetical protein Trydic_g9757 [Trypoxylus dichotomus]